MEAQQSKLINYNAGIDREAAIDYIAQDSPTAALSQLGEIEGQPTGWPTIPS